MSNEVVSSKDLTKSILALMGVDKIYKFNPQISVSKDNIYSHNNKFYKCIKYGKVPTITTKYFQEISIIESYENKNRWVQLDFDHNSPIKDLKWGKIMIKIKAIANRTLDYELKIFKKDDLKVADLLSTTTERKSILVYNSDNSSGYDISVRVILGEDFFEMDSNSSNSAMILGVWVC